MAKSYAALARIGEKWESEHGESARAELEEEQQRVARLAYKKWWMELPERAGRD